jgi:hypothetical protein
MSGMRRGGQLVIALWAAMLPGVAAAQAVSPAVPYYAMDPRMPLTPHADSPVQQQILENYRSQLLQAQRAMLLQNPGGAGREQLDINRQLNGFAGGSASTPTSPATPPPSFGTVPQPPFDAAPR